MQLTPKIEYKQIERESWKLSFTGQNGTSSKIARGDELSRLPGRIRTWVLFVPELSRAFLKLGSNPPRVSIIESYNYQDYFLQVVGTRFVVWFCVLD